MIAILRDKATGRHLAAWAVDAQHGQEAVVPGEGQEILTWATDIPTYHQRARQLAGGDFSACFGATPSGMSAAPIDPQRLDIVAALLALLKYAKASGKRSADPVTYGDLYAVAKLIRERQMNLEDDGSV